MRICLFTPNFYPAVGGAEKDADHIAAGLTQRDHKVVVLTQKISGRVPELPYAVERYVKPPRQNLWPELLGWPLKLAHRRYKFDVVLAFYAYPTGYVAARLKNKLGVGVILCPQGGDLYPHYHALKKARVANIIREGYANADRIVSISQWLTDRLKTLVGEDRLPPVDLVYNGLDLRHHEEEFRSAEHHKPILSKSFILHLGRVASVKRVELAIEAVGLLQSEFRKRGYLYAVVGDGDAMADIREQVRALGIEDVVQLLGTRKGMDKAWLFRHARFFVSTSREEGCPNVTLEAMANGLPMLGSDIGPHRELIGNLGWGRLFRSGDVDDLTAQMRAMLDADLEPLRRRALEVRDRFSLERMVDGYEKACERVCGIR